MSTAAAARLTQLHGEPKSKLAGPAQASDGTEVLVLPSPDQTPYSCGLAKKFRLGLTLRREAP
jgi:hypothetical protein